MSNTTQEFIQLMKHPVKFRMFLFSKLPAAFFSGVRVRDIDESKCVTYCSLQMVFSKSVPVNLFCVFGYGSGNDNRFTWPDVHSQKKSGHFDAGSETGSSLF